MADTLAEQHVDVNRSNFSQETITIDDPITPSRLDRAKDLTRRVLVKTGARKSIDEKKSGYDEHDNGSIFDDVAFDPQKALHAVPDRRTSIKDRFQRGVNTITDAAKNPRRAITNGATRKAAEKVSSQHHDRAADFDQQLVDAHDALDDARSSFGTPRSSTTAARKQGVDDAQQDVDSVVEHRERLRSAWIIGRHVKRARVIRPMTTPPSKVQFRKSGMPNGPPRTQWGPYLGNTVLWHTRAFTSQHIDDFGQPPFDICELIWTVERFLVISAPWQSFLMEIRSIYLWTDPRRTLKWMTLFWTLWYYQHMMTYLIGCTIWMTVSNKLYPTDVQTIRERIKRAQDQTTRVQAWGELIQKHGQQDWIEPLLDETGPLIQLQLGDLTSYLEILQNFYRWERPRKTWATLFLYSCCFLLTALTSMKDLVRLVWVLLGGVFFFSFPIATHYPKYRHIVNPFYWTYWDIPDMAQLAIIQLQEKAITKDAVELEREFGNIETVQENDIERDDSSNWSAEVDYSEAQIDLSTSPSPPTISVSNALRTIQSHDSLTFRTMLVSTQTHSRLTLRRTGIWLHNRREKQFYPYTWLTEMQKIDLEANTDDNHNSNPITSSHQIKSKIHKWKSLQDKPSGLTLIFNPPPPSSEPDSKDHMLNIEERQGESRIRHELALSLSHSDRDKVFSVVLSWSNLKWQPLFSMNRQNKMGGGGKKGEGNRKLDDAIKKAIDF